MELSASKFEKYYKIKDLATNKNSIAIYPWICTSTDASFIARSYAEEELQLHLECVLDDAEEYQKKFKELTGISLLDYYECLDTLEIKHNEVLKDFENNKNLTEEQKEKLEELEELKERYLSWLDTIEKYFL